MPVLYHNKNSFLGMLGVQFRVLFALILREARVKHGRSRLGYTWTIIDPLFLIVVLSLLFSAFSRVPPHGDNFAIFFSTGVLPFQYFRGSSIFVGSSFEANRPLFNYPLVQQIDAALARIMLEGSTHMLIMALVIGAQVILFGVALPADPAFMLLVFCLITLFGFGAGLCSAVLQRVIPSWRNLYHIILGPALFLSCVFYTLDSIPTYYRSILAWNPLVHCVEGFRNGYYPDFPSESLSLGYLFTWGVVLTFFGLFFERIVKPEVV